MAKKSTNKSNKRKKNSIDANLDIGGNVEQSNIVIGHGNTINITPEQISLRALHQLPPAPADFIGRETQIEELLKDFYFHKGATISGITGMGGIGKTALGLVVAHQIAEKYPDAQIFLDLKGTTTPLSTTDIMRHTILSFEPNADLRALDDTNMSATFQSVLHGKKVLLFFDNARSATQIAPLRPPNSCALLVTSRWTFSVSGLGKRRLDVMNENDAESFLLELCPRIKDKAAELAKACAYLPLALRIAGSFLQVNNGWSVEKYLSQLQDRKKRLAILKESRVEADLQGEPDLLAAFELSYNGLSEQGQKHWRTLSVFPASFVWMAASAMWELEEDKTAKFLGLLKRCGLLEYDETSSRYSLHDLLADYARSQMEDGEEQDAYLKHASHYMEVMEITDRLYQGGGDKMLQGLRLFDLEWENIRSAQDWISGHSGDSNQIAELEMSFPNASVYCLNLRLAPRQRIKWLINAITAARKLNRKDVEGAHFGSLGNAYLDLGEVHKAIEFYKKQLVIARKIGDRHSEGNALGNLGNAYADLGKPRKAIEFYKKQLVIVRKTGERQGEGNALGSLGIAYKDLGEVRKAIKYGKQALLIDRENGDRLSESVELGSLGNAHMALGEMRKAIEFYEQALVIARDIGDRRSEGVCLFNKGLALYSLEEKARAIDFVKEALKIYEAIESPGAEDARIALKLWSMLD